MKKEKITDPYRPLDVNLGNADMAYVPNSDLSFICFDSFRSYRHLFSLYHPGHPWNNARDEEFLLYIGAIVHLDNAYKVTKAGLLLFGFDYKIRTVFPYFHLSFFDPRDPLNLKAGPLKIETYSGTWKGNLFDFLLLVTSSLSKNDETLRRLGLERANATLIIELLKESLGIAASYADYSKEGGIDAKISEDNIEIEFPLAEKKGQSISSCPNPTIQNALYSINLTKRKTKGIGYINSILGKLKFGTGKAKLESKENDLIEMIIPLSKEIDAHSGLSASFLDFIKSLSKEETFSRTDVVKATRKSKAMCSLYLSKALDMGLIEIAPDYKKGKYRRI